MNTRHEILHSLIVLGLFAFAPTFASAAVPAFPGAQGGGAVSVGGRGGRVIEVTNLNDSGAGSLRACVLASGPRTCAFRVGGTINLLSSLTIQNSFLTIAGQTAPGGGIQLNGKAVAGPPIVLNGVTDVIVRYIRVRKGFNSGCPLQCGSGIRAPSNNRIIFDHVTTQWSQDEGVDFSKSRNATLSYSITAEPVGNSQTPHATGVLAAGSDPASSTNQTDVDFHHNLTMTNSHRNPLLRGRSSRIVNNLWYNHRSYANHLSGGMSVDVIGNKYVRGPINPNAAWHEVGATLNGGGGKQAPGNPSIYMLGNIGWHQTNPSGDQWVMTNQLGGENGPDTGAMPLAWRRSTPLANTTHPIVAEPVANIEASILPIVGASRRLDCNGNWVSNRDSQDLKLINQYQTNTGAPVTVNGPETGYGGGGYPTLAAGTACTDSDPDGMPDA
ncbi:MAG: hypothetical protein ACREBC_26040, partial [Pyrinomonadaceae bacterium]